MLSDTLHVMRVKHRIGLLGLFTLALAEAENGTTTATGSPRIANQPRAPVMVSVTKCCHEGQSLETSNRKHPVCTEDPNASNPFIKIKGINLESKEQADIQLTKERENPVSRPACNSDFEIHRLETSGEQIGQLHVENIFLRIKNFARHMDYN